MSQENLQTIIVAKTIAKTREAAQKLAEPYAKRIYTSRETGSSWRFRQRHPNDFIKGSFKSFPLPQEPGIVLVYGTLKKASNPTNQRWLQFKGGCDLDSGLREWDFKLEVDANINKAKTANDLKMIAEDIESRDIQSILIRDLLTRSVADRARLLKLTRLKSSIESDSQIYQEIISGRIENPKKRKSKKTIYKKLNYPKTMPDPGPCAWLGSIVEFAWIMDNGETVKNIDENGNAIWNPNSEWMFMWSPKYKAVVSIRRPKNMYKLANVSRYGGAAKMFEHFTARPAENSFEIEVPKVSIHKLGKKAAHIVYRSDKWSATRKESDYIHPFEKGVKIFCGPNIRRPEVFICFGGKLTLTKRGLVW